MYEAKNPLEISAVPSCNPPWTNKSGRPKAVNILKFSVQPKSIVSTEYIKSLNTNTEPKQKEKALISDLGLDSECIVLTQSHSNNTKPSILCVTDEQLENNKKIKQSVEKALLYSCNYPECTYTCKLSCNLTKHQRIHSDDRPYVCDKCTFRTKFGNSLKVHQRIHTSERPYSCETCPYRCNSNSNLKKHNFHRHSGYPN